MQKLLVLVVTGKNFLLTVVYVVVSCSWVVYRSSTAVEVIKPDVYPTLPEEPGIKTLGACRVGIRFPDGSRGHRRFLKTLSWMLGDSYSADQICGP